MRVILIAQGRWHVYSSVAKTSKKLSRLIGIVIRTVWFLWPSANSVWNGMFTYEVVIALSTSYETRNNKYTNNLWNMETINIQTLYETWKHNGCCYRFHSTHFGQFTVTEWPMHLRVMLEARGSRLIPYTVFQRFVNRIDTVSGTEGLEMVCVALQGYCNP